jgi:hypothetical protein
VVIEVVIGIGSVVIPVVLWSLDRWKPARGTVKEPPEKVGAAEDQEDGAGSG